jgi:hypothetical protein
VLLSSLGRSLRSAGQDREFPELPEDLIGENGLLKQSTKAMVRANSEPFRLIRRGTGLCKREPGIS